jgi:hypothetical protein
VGITRNGINRTAAPERKAVHPQSEEIRNRIIVMVWRSREHHE